MMYRSNMFRFNMHNMYIKYIVLIILSFIISLGCITVDIEAPSMNKILSFSNIPSSRVEEFEIRRTYWFFVAWSITEEKMISEILHEQLVNRPGAKGIRNLEIYFFDEYYDSSQKLYRNPLIAAFSLLTSYAYNLYLTYRKSIIIKGEVFY